MLLLTYEGALKLSLGDPLQRCLASLEEVAALAVGLFGRVLEQLWTEPMEWEGPPARESGGS